MYVYNCTYMHKNMFMLYVVQDKGKDVQMFTFKKNSNLTKICIKCQLHNPTFEFLTIFYIKKTMNFHIIECRRIDAILYWENWRRRPLSTIYSTCAKLYTKYIHIFNTLFSMNALHSNSNVHLYLTLCIALRL